MRPILSYGSYFRLKFNTMETETKHKKGYYRILGIAFGIPMGIPISLAIGNITYGPLIGILLGIAIGQILESKYNSKDAETNNLNNEVNRKRLLILLAFGLFILTVFIAEYFYLKSSL